MSAQDNLDTIATGFAAIEARNIELCLSCLDPDFRLHLIVKPLALRQQDAACGRDGFRRYLHILCTSFPDFHLEQVALRAQGDVAYHEMVVHGLHAAALPLPNGLVVPPTHMQVCLPVEAHHTFSPDGRFLTTTSYVDILDVIRQFGS